MSNELTKKELEQLILLARKILWSSPETRKEIQRHSINIIPANFYSNIPLIDEIENSFEYRAGQPEIYNSGVFDPQRIRSFIDDISVYAGEFSPPQDGDKDNPAGYFWKNPAFSYSDAMSYYCVLRHLRPDHVLEIGSGFSTLIADEALKRNGHGRITLIEPYPKEFLRHLDTVDKIDERFAQDIPLAELIELVESAGVWFIDSTHTVKIGSDCLYLYLKVMPAISTDLLVHSHDIFLPFGMPKLIALEKHVYWTEQYLLYAYMLDNPKIEVVFGSAYVNRLMPDAMQTLMAGKYPGGGGSLWYRLNGHSANRASSRPKP